MSLSPNEELCKAIQELQPDNIMEALANGANPYVKVPATDGQSLSALELSMKPNGLTSMFNGASSHDGAPVLGQKLQNAFEKMLDVEPIDNAQRQELVSAHIKAAADNTRSLTAYELMTKQAQDRKIPLSPHASHWFMNQRPKGFMAQMAIIQSQGWKDTVENMGPQDLKSHQQSVTSALDHAKQLAASDIALMHLHSNGEISLSASPRPEPPHQNPPALAFATLTPPRSRQERLLDESAQEQRVAMKGPEDTGSYMSIQVSGFAAAKAARDQARAQEHAAPGPSLSAPRLS